MSFVRSNPPGWAIGDILTSAQINLLDIDHSKALNGGNADGVQTDTLHTQISLSPTGTITSGVSGGIQATQSGGIQGLAIGSIAAVATASIHSTAAAGGFSLDGGANDWPIFGTTRSRIVTFPMAAGVPTLASGWSIGSNFGPTLLSTAVAGSTQILSIPALHNGARLNQIVVRFSVGTNHAGIPGVLPVVSFVARDLSGNLIISVPGSPASPASGVAWFNGGAVQAFSFTPNVTITTVSQYYYLTLVDENGANALTGNIYYDYSFTYDTIPNMAFP